MSHDILRIPLEEIVGDRFGRYSKYIIQERALPDVRDGLKPVQRRILYAMHIEKNTFDKGYRKSAKTVGLVIGNFHPHGDSSVYDAMVRLSQSWKMNMPLVDMQGNNGSVDDDPAAAMRYTEARLSKLSSSLLENIGESVVPFVLNFDDTTQEPVVLPARYPNLLVNGATGIAAGYATNIPPFNLAEILDATIYRLQNSESTIEELMTLVKGPDFPTGGIVQGQAGIEDILKTGRGRVVVRAKTEIVRKKSLAQIVITELPYEVIKSNVVRKIDELRFAKANEGLGDVMDVRDESDRNGLRIVIDCKADSDVESILNLFFKHTELQVYYNANMVSIINQRPQLCGLLPMLDAYIEFRQEVVLNRSKYRYDQKEKRIHIIEGLIKATSVLDEIIRIIRASKNRSDSRDNIMAEFGFSHLQASAIVDLQLYRLSSTDVVALRDEFAQLANELEELNLIINNKDMLNLLIRRELLEIKERFAIERRTRIEGKVSELEIDHMSLISNDDVMITVSNFGYVKKVSMRSYASSQVDTVALNEGDYPVVVAQAQTLDTLVFVTTKGRYGYLLIHDIDEARWRDVGSHINQYMKLQADERIINAFTVKDFNTYMFVVTVSSTGLIKKSLISDLEVKRSNKLFDLMNLGKDSVLVGAFVAQEADHLLMTSKEGQIIRLDLLEVNPIGLKAKGIIGMKLRSNDTITSACILSTESETVVISNRHQFKRIKSTDIPVMNRATLGISVARKIKSKPHQVSKVLVGNIYDTISIYHDKLDIIEIKSIPLMDFEASYSQVVKLDAFTVIEPLIDVKMVEAPKEIKVNVNEPLKLDI